MKQKVAITDSVVSGEINFHIVPEKMATLGTVIENVLGDKLAVGTDGLNGSLMVKNAVVSGMLSGGASVIDFAQQTPAITRRGIKFYNQKGGVYIHDNGQKIFIFSNEGMLPDKSSLEKIEKFLMSEKCARALPAQIQEVISLQSYKSYYVRDLLRNIKSEKLGYNILVSVKNVAIKALLITIMSELGCKLTLYKGSNENTDKEFGEAVNKKYDLGMVINDDGESFTFFDNKGKALSKEIFDCICAVIIFKEDKQKVFMTGEDSSFVLENIAALWGGRISRNTKYKNLIMACEEADKDGISSSFLFNFDPVGSIIKIMDFLKTENSTLEEVAGEIPGIYMMKRKIRCEDSRDVLMKLALKNGIADISGGEIKIYHKNGWALVSRETNNENVNIICEGLNAEMAEELMADYTKIINEL